VSDGHFETLQGHLNGSIVRYSWRKRVNLDMPHFVMTLIYCVSDVTNFSRSHVVSFERSVIFKINIVARDNV